MSSEEFPRVPTRPQRRTASPSPTPPVPIRPASKPHTDSLPRVPTKRPTRTKTAELDELMVNTDNELREMKGLIRNRTVDSRNQFQELKTQEDKLQSGIEELLGQPGSYAKEQELQDEKERLLRRRQAMLEERKKQQLAREEEMKALERRREQLLQERDREREIERQVEEEKKREAELAKEAEENLERRAEDDSEKEMQMKRQKELETEQELQKQKEIERQRESEEQLRQRKKEELTRQRDLELEEKRQRELERKQEEELQAKKKELELLENERQQAKKKVQHVKDYRGTSSASTESVAGKTPLEGAYSAADSAFLDSVGKDFGLKPSEPKIFPQMPERPRKTFVGSKTSKNNSFEKLPTNGPEQTAAYGNAEEDLASSGTIESKSQTPFVPERPKIGTGDTSSDSLFSPSNRRTSASEARAESPSIPERPIAFSKKPSSESPALPDNRPNVSEKKNDSPSVREKPSFVNKKLASEFPDVPARRPSDKILESPSIPERPNVFGSNSSLGSPVIPDKRPDSNSIQSQSLLTGAEADEAESSPSILPAVPDRRPDLDNKNSPSPDIPSMPEKRPTASLRQPTTLTEPAPESHEITTDSLADANSVQKEMTSSVGGESDSQLQSELKEPDAEEVDVDNTKTLPLAADNVDESETVPQKLSDNENSSASSITNQKSGEDSNEENSKELSKKKVPPVPKKPSSRIFAFQEMLRKQQMEEIQSSRNQVQERADNQSVSSSETLPQPSVPQRPHRPVNEERSKFANNLNGLFALPGMSPMSGGMPPSFAKKLNPSAEEKKDSKPAPSVRQPRARGPRGRKLPSNVAAVEKVSSESKTNEIEIFRTWRTVISEPVESSDNKIQELYQESVNIEDSSQEVLKDDEENKVIEIADPTNFDLHDPQTFRPVGDRMHLEGSSKAQNPSVSSIQDSVEIGADLSSPNEDKLENFSEVFPETVNPMPATTFSFQEVPGNSQNSTAIDLEQTGEELNDAQSQAEDSKFIREPKQEENYEEFADYRE